MRFRQYLNEKTYKISTDVDLIYNKYFKKILKPIQKGDIKTFMSMLDKTRTIGGEYSFGNIESSKLKSKQSKIASDTNPVDIKMGVFDAGSFYRPSKNMIYLSLNKNVISILSTCVEIDDVKRRLGNKVAERFLNELSEGSMKGSIYHELSHWLNDTFHNFNITKRLDKAQKVQDMSIMQKGGSVLFTDYEIDAQVHAIKQLKRVYKKEWDTITWDKIVQYKASFNVIFDQLKRSPAKIQKSYMKTMLKRLNREKLLGKAMQRTFTDML